MSTHTTAQSSATRPTVTIRIDQRETASGVPRHLAEIPGIQVTVEVLALGDYHVGGTPIEHVVERKSALDFAVSLVDGRLFEQLRQIVSADCAATLILEGDPLASRSRVQPEALLGALSYITTVLRIPILPSTGPMRTAALLARMAQQLQVGYREPGPVPVRRGATTAEQQRAVLRALPGIGEATAQALLARFGSVRGVATAALDDLAAVPRVGSRTAARIVQILGDDHATTN